MVEIIAEAGVAHYGDYDKATRLARASLEAGATYLKTQVFDASKLTSDPAWRDRLSGRETTVAMLRAMGDVFGPNFTFSMHELSQIHLFAEFHVPFIKIGSGEVGNYGYIEELARLGRPLVMSTGMWEFEEIDRALNVAGRYLQDKDLTIMHCVTMYPTPPALANLGRIVDLKQFGVRVGYSDHTQTGYACFMAIALGATLIERHIVLDEDHPEDSQDHLCAHRPKAFRDFVKRCHEASTMLGRDQQARDEWATKSWHASKNIMFGQTLTEDNCEMKRPGDGYTGKLGDVRLLTDKVAGEKIGIDDCDLVVD